MEALEIVRPARERGSGFEGLVSVGDADRSDFDLVVRAKNDRSAFSAIYARYYKRVYGYAFHRLGEHAKAEDVTALTFERALVSLHTCREKQFRAWLFTIARNAITDAQRQDWKIVPIEHALAVADKHPQPSDFSADLESRRRVHALLTRLPEAQRRIVELRLAGLTGAEISRVLGRSHVSVRVSQYRAYATLRDILELEPELLDGTT